LRWEEARVSFVPIGATVRGVVEEIRPYGAFISLIVAGSGGATILGEDSRIRGFCEDAEFGPEETRPSIGEQIAVKLLTVDHRTQRIFVSAMQAEPRWSPPRETMLKGPSFYEAQGLF